MPPSHPRFATLLLACAIWCVSPPPCAASPQSDSVKDVRLLSPDWFCLVVDLTAEILQARDAAFSAVLKKDRAAFEQDTAAGKKNWYYDKSKQYHTLLIQNNLHRKVFTEFNTPGFWALNGRAPADLTIWAHSVDGFPGEHAEDAPALDSLPNCRTADLVYLKLPAPLQSGETLRIESREGRDGRLAFDDTATVCWSLKVNQSGYRSGMQSNKAYLGMWIPGVGPANFDALVGKPFYIRKFEPGKRQGEGRASGEALLSGRIALRKTFKDQEIQREGGSNLTGEDVYELDFSALSLPASRAEELLCVHVPGLGRSWPFRVHPNGYGEAFYTVMKGLFTQRCGIALQETHSAWKRGACHTDTRPGRFPPETEGWYRGAYRRGSNQFGFRDAEGKQIAPSSFTIVGNSDAAGAPIPGLHGGWHDAADFDRRIFHYNVVSDLLAAYELCPHHFRDKQLNLPESGNGVPDLLDEALWGVEVWRKTQTAAGGVSSWIEEKSHPGTRSTLKDSIEEDPLQMFVSLPDRAGSFAYAAAASWLGRLLAPFNKPKSAELIASAQKAYAWANSPAAVLKNWEMEILDPGRDPKLKGQKIRFDEDPELRKEDMGWTERAFAAANLFLATRTPSYLADWNAFGMGKAYGSLAHQINPCRTVPLLLSKAFDPGETAAMLQTLRTNADALGQSQESHAYRMLWLGAQEGWFHTLAWGNFHSKLRLVAVVYGLTREEPYLKSLGAGADFFLGCNPMGTTLVSGLGSVFPVVFQHIHSQADGIAEPTPGIAPYWFTYGVPTPSFLLADAGHASVKSFFTPFALALLPDKWGRAELQAKMDAAEKTGDWIRDTLKPARDVLWKNWPVFRRHVTHPGAVVEQNEFTVNETLSPLILGFGVLTGEGWMPSRELAERKPRTKLEELPYYAQP